MKGLYLLSCVCIAMIVSIQCHEKFAEVTKRITKRGGHACEVAKEITAELLMEWANKTVDDFKEPEMEAPRYKLGCYAACWMQDKDIVTNDKINKEKVNEIIKMGMSSSEEMPQQKLETTPQYIAIQNCITAANTLTDICEIGWEFGKCMSPYVGF